MNVVQDSEFEGAPTTRRFARTLSEAFADERAPAVEKPAPSFSRTCNAGHIAALILPLLVVVAAIVLLFTRSA